MSKFSPVSRSRLLLGASVSALIFTAAPALADGTTNPFARVANPAVAAAQAAATQATQGSQATAASQRALAAFAQAAAIRRNMDTAQIAARAVAAAQAAAIPNGLTTGGLQTADGAIPGSPLWLNANAPTQTTTSDGRTEVTVEQTKAQAILNWKTFNVGRQTDVNFDQKGNASWVVLNRVTDPDANASKIAGTIKAPGTVMIMNRNGVIFKGTSQVNVGSLVAAAGKITNDQFLQNGIYSGLSANQYLPSITDALGAVKVDAGAQLFTNAPTSATQGGGYVMLLGGTVENDGAITTPKGQSLLAAGDAFNIRAGFGTAANQTATTRGSEVAPVIAVGSTNGNVVNTGVITATQGDITLAGRTITQGGVAIATTSVNQRGTIHLLNSQSDAQGSVILTGDSLTAVLPELGAADTALDSQRDALVASSGYNGGAGGQFDNLSPVTDRKDQSRIEIVSGGNIDFQTGSYTLAQGGQIAATASNRIQTDNGAWLDVSGVRDVAMDPSTNAILVNVQGNELRDSPVNRDNPGKPLYSAAGDGIWVNVNDLIYMPAGTGGDTADRYYTPGGLLEVSGWIGNTAHTIGEWDAVGGTITLQAKEVVAQQGSMFNISGGTLAYSAGATMETLLQGADGHIYTANNAPAGIEMVSIGKSFALLHPRWGGQYTEVYQNPFAQKSVAVQQDAYLVGRDAGQLILSAPTVLFDGDIDAEVVQGATQTVAHPVGVTDGYKTGQANAALEGHLAIGRLVMDGTQTEFDTDVRIGTPAPSLIAGLTDAVPDDRQNTAWLDAGALNKDNLGGLTVITGGIIAIDAPLTLASGGGLTLTAPTVNINADITVHGGQVALGDITHAVLNPTNGADIYWSVAGVTPAQVTVGPDTAIDLTGLWTNLVKDADSQAQLAYLDGGSLRIFTTGGITLGAGSSIDASSGGALLMDGTVKGGKGGDVYLAVNDVLYPGLPAQPNGEPAQLILDGDIRSNGFNGGGVLTLAAGQTVVIGEDSNLAGGTLAAGTTTATSVRLSGDVTLAAGDTIPFAWDVTTDRAPLDVPITEPYTTNFGDGVVTTADWVLPNNLVATVQGSRYFGGQRIPSGTMLLSVATSSGGLFLPVGAVLPSAVFGSGVPIAPVRIKSYAAGDTLTDPVVLPKGYVVAQGVTFDRDVAIAPVLTLNPALFQSGFSSYNITSATGMEISAGTAAAPVVPVYRFTNDSIAAASGADLRASAQLWTPPTYLENPVKGQLTQRTGADLTLSSLFDFDLARGASIAVDPGHAATLYVNRQTTISGDITAPGGAITINSQLPTALSLNNYGYGYFTPTRSVWIDDGAVLDVAGRAVVATDVNGHRYGIAPDGGVITLGSPGIADPYGYPAESHAFIVIRPDALLDASGAGATIDAQTGPGGPFRALDIAGDGGTINLGSRSGIYLDGTLRAAAGGPNAAGGTLDLSLVSEIYIPTLPFSQLDEVSSGVVSPEMQKMRAITIMQDHAPSGLAADARPGDALVFGQGTLGVDQLHAGGFDAVSLYSRDAFEFDGDVNLSLGRSVAFAGAFLNTTADAPDSHVTISAPHVSIEGTYTNTTVQLPSPNYYPGINTNGPGSPSTSKDSSFTINADLIDLTRDIGFGTVGSVGNGSIDSTTPTGIPAPNKTIDLPGFGQVVLNSSGDIRLGAGSFRAADLTLQAAQIYPLSGAAMAITVGLLPDGTNRNFDPDAMLIIRGNGGPAPAAPDSVFGRVSLVAPAIDQGGVLRAPLGAIEFDNIKGNGNVGFADSLVTFRAGSLTSTSTDGLILPFGGTSDGISYAGGVVPLDPSTNLPINVASTVVNDTGTYRIVEGISVTATQVVGEAGSRLDVSGGGTLAGAGFLSGRGGSVDVLKTPLVNANPANPGKAGDKVYAIVPGYASNYAPVIATKGAGDPAIGQQITLTEPAGGLAAGTYTLLPSSYAVLPGAVRAELTGTAPVPGASVKQTDGTIITSGYLGIANTNIRDSQATGLILSPGTTVRAYSQYNEESYSDFARAQATQFGALRERLPEDAGVLLISVGSPQDGSQALQFAGSANFAGAKGGYDGSLLITATGDFGELDITAPDGVAMPGHTAISSDSINAFNASTLILGGVSTYARADGADAGDRIALQGQNNINLLDGSDVRAAAVFLVGNNIDIAGGATVDTRGLGANGIDSSTGYLYGNTTSEVQSPGGPAVVAIGNGYYNFLPPSGNATLNIASGATLLTDGTISISAGGALTMGDVNFGAKILAVTQNQINAGSDAALAAAQANGVLAPGWTLSQEALDRLLRPSATSGAPALQELILTAGDAISLFGNVALDASGHDVTLVLDTPAIYGLGAAGDVASIKADTITWNGIRTGNGSADLNPVPYGSKPPAPIMPGGAGTGQGTLEIDAKTILFGYDPTHQRTDGTTLNRVALGFGTVALNASDRMTTNDDGTLSVAGDLALTTPLVTASQGANMAFIAGGVMTVGVPAGIAPGDTTAVTDLGGTLSFTGASVAFDTAAALPSGKLTLAATNDVTLGDNARIDLDGRAVSFFDITQYGWGGDLVLTSEQGSIRQAAGSVIDVSAGHNDAGTISAAAGNGVVALDGTLMGQGADGYAGGSIALTQQTIADFDGLNDKLDAAGFFTSRGFDIKQGDLVVDKTVKAGTVAIAVDGGSLTVSGTIDASGPAPGTIRLAARDDLTLTGTALLDAHGTVLQIDSYGQAVEASNTAHVELAATGGTVTLASGATIDLRAADDVARGKLEIDAKRLGLGDVAVQADSGLVIKGAGSVAVNAFQTYDLPGGTVIDQAMLDGFDADSRAFIDASYDGSGHLTGNLQTKLGGLLATGDAFHYRPGVEIVSSGDLSTDQDLDLAGYRYGPGVDPAKLGSGEAGKLVIRAAGNVNINGSVTDGFAPPPNSPDSNQWLTPIASYVPTVNVPASGNITLAQDWTIPNDGFYPFAIIDSAFTNFYFPGDVIPAGTTIVADDIGYGPLTWEAGLPIPATYVLGAPRPVYALAAPLAAGSQSWSMSIVAGADTAAADVRTLRTQASLAGSGNIVLNDAHFAEGGSALGYSVIRTGTGDLSLLAGGNVDQESAYGIYTAGTPIAATGTAANDPYNVGRGVFADGTLLGSANDPGFEASLGDQRMYYVEHGGDVLVSAQGNIEGKAIADRSTNVGDWLWRQGGSADQATAWGINFGSYAGDYSATTGALYPRLDGFSGIGALGGGNVSLVAGGNIGDAGRGVVAAVGATGRVMADGSLAQTGGGTLTVKAGGSVGTGGNQFVDLRGDTSVSAGDFGESYSVDFGYHQSDPRPLNPLTPYSATRTPGGSFAPGDGNVEVRARGDLVMGATINPGLATSVAYTDAGDFDQGATWFSLWNDRTEIDLFAAGGDLSPFADGPPTLYMPPVFKAVAPGGNIYLTSSQQLTAMQLPSPYGALDLLAGGSVIQTRGSGGAIGALSSPLSAIATPFQPGWLTQRDGFGSWTVTGTDYYGDPKNVLDLAFFGTAIGMPFVFAPNNVTDDSAAAVDGIQSHIYAVNGDILGLIYGRTYTGQTFENTLAVYHTSYQPAKPVDMLAGQDILNLTGFILHEDPNDVSTIAAGRDILYAGLNSIFYNANTRSVSPVAGLQIAGPGTLELTAGRNLFEGSTASVESIGAIITGDDRPGASVVMAAGIGAGTPGIGAVDWDGFADLYLDPANLIGTVQGQPEPLEGSGKVAKTYNDELFAWMTTHYAYAGAQADVLSAFQALPAAKQRVFLRQVYYAELTAAGREYNNPDSSRFGSYLRGRNAIAELFPDADKYAGNITMFSTVNGDHTLGAQPLSGSVHTDFGGDIQFLAPSGGVTVGTEGLSPGSNAGLVTQGAGDIDIYAEDSVLLGLSRIMTTFGGDILAWSATGDINAGRGSKTTVVFTPPKRTYDLYGQVMLAPQVPSTGAGIATLAPIPEVPPGDIDLIAPLGTVDAGEAGIRVSGNINIAALHVANAANIQVKGTATGLPQAVSVNTGALTSAANAAAAVSNLASQMVPRSAPMNVPKILVVQFLGFGEE